MDSIRDDTIGGFNTFLRQQQEEKSGMATLTLVQFDSQDPYEVIHSFRPVNEVQNLTRETYVPRASTPLMDAIGRGIIDLETQLIRLRPEERPSKIVFVIVTDGKENSSTIFTKEQISKMIKEKTEKDWQFVFLSADLEAIKDASNVGFQADSILHFEKDCRGTQLAWSNLSQNTSDYRASRKKKFYFDVLSSKPSEDPEDEDPEDPKLN